MAKRKSLRISTSQYCRQIDSYHFTSCYWTILINFNYDWRFVAYRITLEPTSIQSSKSSPRSDPFGYKFIALTTQPCRSPVIKQDNKSINNCKLLACTSLFIISYNTKTDNWYFFKMHKHTLTNIMAKVKSHF